MTRVHLQVSSTEGIQQIKIVYLRIYGLLSIVYTHSGWLGSLWRFGRVPYRTSDQRSSCHRKNLVQDARPGVGSWMSIDRQKKRNETTEKKNHWTKFAHFHQRTEGENWKAFKGPHCHMNGPSREGQTRLTFEAIVVSGYPIWRIQPVEYFHVWIHELRIMSPNPTCTLTTIMCA